MRFELDRLTEYGNDAILDEIRRVAALVEAGRLTTTEFNKHSKVHSSTVQARFGGWGKALVAAGLGNRFWGPATDEAMLEEIRRVAGIIDCPTLSKAQFDRYANITSAAVQTRFGGWGKALAAAGLGHLYQGKPASFTRRSPEVAQMSDAEILGELRRVAQVVGTDVLTSQHLRANSPISYNDVRRRFGLWDNGLHRAGLHLSRFGRRYSEKQYFENLLAVWTHYGRPPRHSEMDKPPSVISAPAYVKRFGRWTNALAAFVERMNEPEEASTGTIGATLRWAILNRDGFRCVRCGRTPEADRRCELHVDHIVPSSKGGPTSPENLRTTCSACNLGKGDRLE